MSATDPYDTLRQLLLNDATVTALADDRVGFEVDEADNRLMPRTCVVLTPTGGPGDGSFQEWGSARVDVTCYGATLTESRTLALAVNVALKNLRTQAVGDTLFHAAVCTAKPATARDPVTLWPTTYSSWLITTAETV